jgi:peptidylprolyl isomerase
VAEIKDPENTILMEMTKGNVVIELLPDLAPGHVARIKELTREGAYDGVVFHRVIDGFMAQTGDVQYGKSGGPSFNPGRAGIGGSDKPDLKAEFSNVNHGRGTCSMARAQNPNSANSQFFICFDDASFLNNNYTVVGDVVSGMDVVDKLKKAPAGSRSGTVTDPDKMLKVQVASDIK